MIGWTIFAHRNLTRTLPGCCNFRHSIFEPKPSAWSVVHRRSLTLTMIIDTRLLRTTMMDKSFQCQNVLFLLLASLVAYVHCKNISLDGITLVLESQTTNNSMKCLKRFDNRERKDKLCVKEFCNPSLKLPVILDKEACLTGTIQTSFDKNDQLYISVSRCQKLANNNVSNLSCQWLLEVYNKQKENKLFLSVILNCKNATEDEGQWCSVLMYFFNSSSGNEDTGMNSCLFTPRTNDHTGTSSLRFLKENITSISCASAGVFLILIVVLANRVRRHYKRGGSSHTPESEPDMPNSDEDGLYHEPDNHHTYVDVDDTASRNYEYAYGHFDVGTPRINVIDIPAERYPNYMNIARDKPGCEEDYLNIDNASNEDYDNYQSLDRSSMVNDNALYQGLTHQKDRVRPKIAPKPGHLRRGGKPVVSYVKVM